MQISIKLVENGLILLRFGTKFLVFLFGLFALSISVEGASYADGNVPDSIYLAQAQTKSKGQKKTSSTKIKGKDTSGRDSRSNIKVGYILTLFPAASFQTVTYLVPETNPATTYWKKRSPIIDESFKRLGFGGEFELDFSFISIAAGARYVSLKNASIVTDYSKSTKTLYAESTTTVNAVGFYGDIYIANFSVGDFSRFKIGIGADYDMSSFYFSCVQKADNSNDQNPVAEHESKMNLVSLRISTPFEWLFSRNGLGINFGTHILVPMTEIGKSSKTTIYDQTIISSLGQENSKLDLELATAHKKSPFGLMIMTSMDYGF